MVNIHSVVDSRVGWLSFLEVFYLFYLILDSSAKFGRLESKRVHERIGICDSDYLARG